MKRYSSRLSVLLLLSPLLLRCGAEPDSPTPAPTATADLDQDGYSWPEDCDDTNADVHPNADPVCHILDSNCDGQSDPMPDRDSDGASPCDLDPGLADCDDTTEEVRPGASEICNQIDDDCDGEIDEDFDSDQDGFSTCEADQIDCDDSSPLIYPGAEERCDDHDNNCDGEKDEYLDQDGDGYTLCSLPTADCNDLDPHMAPQLEETCDGLDNDCDGDVDEGFDWDADGVSTCQKDCDDSNPLVYPGATEICDNGTDEDCNFLDAITGDQDGDGHDDCDLESPDCDDSSATDYVGAPELCDFKDNDCDGLQDEFLAADPHEPNNDAEAATDLGTLTSVPIETSGSLEVDTDQDWYKFYLSASEDLEAALRVALKDLPEGSGYSFVLFAGDSLLSLGAGLPVSPSEISLTLSGLEEDALPAGWYYVLVTSTFGPYGCPSYRLVLTLSS